MPPMQGQFEQLAPQAGWDLTGMLAHAWKLSDVGDLNRGGGRGDLDRGDGKGDLNRGGGRGDLNRGSGRGHLNRGSGRGDAAAGVCTNKR